ncbi:cytochrome P450 2C5-like isoform X2 [Engystomops pustulosus]|uniref:cytochrome P450 2C5-like isoform X2 n=1 Tax=Engystomops pustulosus TaxID=76066 RepID=UPI003AFA7950
MLYVVMSYQEIYTLSETYGPVYTIKLGEKKTVVLCGYDAVKDALVHHADEFSGRPHVPLLHDITKGHGVIFASDENWRVMRRFTMTTLRDFGMGKETIENKILEELECLVERFRSYKGEAFDNSMIMNAAVCNIIVSILLSNRFDYEDPTLLKLLKIVNDSIQLIGTPMAMLHNAYPSVMRWCSGVQKTVMKNVEEMHAFIRETFTKQRTELDVNDQRNLIDSFLVKQQEEKPELFYTNENLTVLVTDLFSAGMETTSSTLRWGLLLMMKYPEIQRKVQKEIEKVIGSAEPQNSHRKEMPYTDAVLHEIQRFGNIVPNNLPHATTQDVNFRGYLLPKGTHVMPLLTSVLYDKEHFVKADEFYPEHFLDSSGNFVRKDAFLPFSAGKRSCAGENLAKMELFMFFTRLLQNFTFQAPPGATLDLTPAVGLTAAPLPYKICAIPRI